MASDPVAAVLAQFPFPVSCALFSFESVSLPGSCQLLGSWGEQDKVYPWMSVTKLVTSRTVLGAVENGVLELSEPLPQLPGVSEPRPVSVADLLAHRAGLDHEKREFTRAPRSRRVCEKSWRLLSRPPARVSYLQSCLLPGRAVMGCSFREWCPVMVFTATMPGD